MWADKNSRSPEKILQTFDPYRVRCRPNLWWRRCILMQHSKLFFSVFCLHLSTLHPYLWFILWGHTHISARLERVRLSLTLKLGKLGTKNTLTFVKHNHRCLISANNLRLCLTSSVGKCYSHMFKFVTSQPFEFDCLRTDLEVSTHYIRLQERTNNSVLHSRMYNRLCMRSQTLKRTAEYALWRTLEFHDVIDDMKELSTEYATSL